jgi:hypothetical protein
MLLLLSLLLLLLGLDPDHLDRVLLALPWLDQQNHLRLDMLTLLLE